MRGTGKDAESIAARRIRFTEAAYELFSSKDIHSVSLQDIADATPYGIATLYRYFANKQTIVVEAAAWKWRQFLEENRKRRPHADFSGMTAAESFGFYLDSFLELYRNHQDLLRFNQFFNIYVQVEKVDAETVKPYQAVIGEMEATFHEMYVKGLADHTLRTDIPEKEMFSTTLHLMLAAVTRYAVGLLYQAGTDSEKELELLKELLMMKFLA